MISPISSDHSSEPTQQSPPPKPEHPAQPSPTEKSGTVSRDQVTLKSAGQVDGDDK